MQSDAKWASIVRLGDITQETLCFWGVNDKFCPVSGASKVAPKTINSPEATST